MKNNLIPISIFALALSILIIGYQYLDVYKIKNNYNTINVSTVEIIDNLTPTVLYATFNVDFGKYDLNKGPSFEQNNAIKILTEKIKNKFIKENIKDATINWGTLSNFSTSSNYKTQIRIYVPIKNEIDESKLNQLLKEFNPESLYISKNVNDKEYEELSSKVENLNLAKNRKQADEKAKA